MRQNIKAKETYYDGYRFRSRLEARWAVFFNNIGLEYEYKMEGFNMKQYLHLLLYALSIYRCFGIKGQILTASGTRKRKQFCRRIMKISTTKKPVWLFLHHTGASGAEVGNRRMPSGAH